jgi:hypothetical protein
MEKHGGTEPRGRRDSHRSITRLIAFVVPAAAACVIEPGTVKTPDEKTVDAVPYVRRYTVACDTRSPRGFGAGFHDPRNGGECWACPNTNPERTWSAVTAPDACATKAVLGIGAKVASAKYLGPYDDCPRGDVKGGGYCSYCPPGSAWNAQHGVCVKP